MHGRSDPHLSQFTIGELLVHIASRITSDAWTAARLTIHRDGAGGEEPVILVVTRKDSEHGPR